MTFDPIKAMQLARLLEDAPSGGVAQRLHAPRTDTQAYVIRDPARTILLFPGTEGARDVRTDLKVSLVSWYAGKVHRGFRAAAMEIWPLTMAAMPPAGKRQPLLLAGHSLGGALAQLIAHAAARDHLPLEAVYTYGQPRAGNGGFARAYDAQPPLHEITFRCVNHRDPIPRVPWLLGRYRHAGREVYLPKTGPAQVERSLWARFTEALERWQTPEEPRAAELAGFADHSLRAYIARLERL